MISASRTARVAQSTTLLEVRELRQSFPVPGRRHQRLNAVAGVSFDLLAGEALGVVGETGCGKSTMARAIMQAPRPESGEVRLFGEDLVKLDASRLRQARRHIRMVFQDPFSSLDPHMRVKDIVREPLLGLGRQATVGDRARVDEVLHTVGLDPAVYASRHPRDLSGGQCQRVAIARALSVSPELLVCDEVVSALDVLIQAQILDLFEDLRNQLGLSYLFISHDLPVVKQVSDRVAVMYLGRFCETATTELLFERPAHPYTAALLSANPSADPRQAPSRPDAFVGEQPSALDPPSGCVYRTRCPHADDRCALEVPELRQIAPDHMVACHHPLVAA